MKTFEQQCKQFWLCHYMASIIELAMMAGICGLCLGG